MLVKLVVRAIERVFERCGIRLPATAADRPTAGPTIGLSTKRQTANCACKRIAVCLCHCAHAPQLGALSSSVPVPSSVRGDRLIHALNKSMEVSLHGGHFTHYSGRFSRHGGRADV